MGLFSPPRVNILKRIPQHAMLEAHAIETYADMQLDDLQQVQRHHAVAFVLSVWACNSSMAGKFQLSQLDFSWIQNAGMNSTKALSSHLHDRIASVVEELIDKGLIPTGE